MKQLVYTGKTPQRLDAFLLGLYPYVPAGTWHKALRQGKIKLNGKKQALATRLNAGDEVCLYLPGTALQPPAPHIIHEDARLLVANKPAGLATLAAGGDSLLQRVTALPGSAALPDGFPAPCHRLDTGTSGLVLFAKDAGALAFIEGLQRQHLLKKQYLCVTYGHPPGNEATLTGWHTKDAAAGHVRISETRRPGAKPVTTKYRVLHADGPLALLEVTLVTGRTHQIRAHLASVGAPVLGDSKYGNLAANRQYRLRYQALCAYSIRFPGVREAGFESFSGLSITAPQPWYYTQMLDGTLGTGAKK